MESTFAIAIDLDETLAGTFRKVFEYGSKKHGWTLPFEEAVVEHDWWGSPELGLTREQAFALFDEYFLADPTETTIPQIRWAREGVLEIMGMGGDPFVITARTESVRSKGTASWLAAHLPEIDFANRVRFTNHYVAGGVGKGRVCRSVGADILIDDNIEFVRDAAACGVIGILLDQPWNRNCRIPDTAVRVSGWHEIPATVERIRKRTN